MPEDLYSIDAVFVYGTLKRGQCRESDWPADPLAVTECWIRGDLHGRDDYPALVPGECRVVGELWIHKAESMPLVLDVLDAIEGTHGNASLDLYHRHVVDVFSNQGQLIRRAYTYFYNRDPLPARFAAVPIIDGVQTWPRSGSC